jgi:hypothetical protein
MAFDPGPGTNTLSSNGGYEIFILKLDAAGNFVWAKSIGASGHDVGNSIAVDGWGNIAATGHFNSVVDFDPGSGTSFLTAGSNNNAFILRMDSTGNLIWARQFGAGSAKVDGLAVDLDRQGNVYTAGIFGWSGVDFDPGMGTYNFNPWDSDTYLSKLDTAGNFIWAQQITGSFAQAIRGLYVDASGTVFASGQYADSADFDPGTATYMMTASSLLDAYVLKLRQCTITHDTLAKTVCDAYTSPSGNHVWTASGTYGDTLTNVGGCDSILVVQLTVVTAPLQPGPILGDTLICSGSSNLYFIAPIPGAASYTWTLPSSWLGTSLDSSIQITAGTNSGSITVTANNGCGSSMTQSLPVTVVPTPIATFSFNTVLLSAMFTDLSAGGTSWHWDFGDGDTSTLQHPSHVYTAPGTYTVCLVVTNNGCSDTTCQGLTVIAVGTEPTRESDVKIFPNPSTGLFKVETAAPLQGTVVDVHGKVIKEITLESGCNALDLQGCADGLYFLRLCGESLEFQLKLVKAGN